MTPKLVAKSQTLLILSDAVFFIASDTEEILGQIISKVS
jgi:hypothetical protein